MSVAAHSSSFNYLLLSSVTRFRYRDHFLESRLSEFQRIFTRYSLWGNFTFRLLDHRQFIPFRQFAISDICTFCQHFLWLIRLQIRRFNRLSLSWGWEATSDSDPFFDFSLTFEIFQLQQSQIDDCNFPEDKYYTLWTFAPLTALRGEIFDTFQTSSTSEFTMSTSCL